jgi:transcriptional regulator GlxA family with amidase domain
MGAASAGAAIVAAKSLGAPPASRPEPRRDPIKVAVLIDDRATLIDFAGLWQALGDTGVANVPGFDVFSVAPEKKVYQTYGALRVEANYSFGTCPAPEIVYMGAQAGSRPGAASQAKLDFIKRAHQNGALIAAACTGSLIVAQTGLLDGRQATTHHDFYDMLASNFPKVTVVRDRRIVPQGDQVVTAGGEACSLDLGLWIVERYYGAETARAVAKYMEYIPNPGAIV